jgi:twitching motility protein PilT
MDLNALLRRAVDRGATDIHLKVGQPPILRLDGDLTPLEDHPTLDDDGLATILATVAHRAPDKLQHFHQAGDLDIAYQDGDLPRFRVNAYRQRSAISFAFRVIPKTVPTFEQLNLPPGVEKLAHEHRGLILVTGATGSGKTTTLAAIIDYMNRNRKQHIITIEDPIEILHPDRGCIVNQREVGLDTESFGQALRRALRQDPDTILIGELRDAETAQTALQAAESGHLVLSTLHTIDAAETVGRMIEFFPPEKQEVIRAIMAGVLRGVISQRLLPKFDGGRVAAVEVMVMNARIADLIREGRSDEITDAVAEGEFFQMQTFTQALIDHVLAGRVDEEVAANAATNKHDFLVALERAWKKKRHEDAVAAETAQAAEPLYAAEPVPADEPAPLAQPQPDPVAPQVTETPSGLRIVG